MSNRIDLVAAQRRALDAAKSVIAAEWYAETHPEDAHGADGIAYATDEFEDALVKYANHLYGDLIDDLANPS